MRLKGKSVKKSFSTLVLDDLETFKCAIYCSNFIARKVDGPRVSCISKLYIKRGKSIPSNADMSSQPPCHKSPSQHVRRVNAQVPIALWKRAIVLHPVASAAVQGHEWLMTTKDLHPLWYEEGRQPKSLKDVCQEHEEESSAEESTDIQNDESDKDVDTGSYHK